MDEDLVKVRHDRSLKDFPNLKLEDDEYVEFAFFRAKSWLWLRLGALIAGVIVALAVFLVLMVSERALDTMGRNFMLIIFMVLAIAAGFAAYVIVALYKGNRLFVTNKHVIQMIMLSPMANSVSMIDLASIEDASFSQDGIMAKLLRYGVFRLSTVGDETTYTFNYANVSGTQLKAVSKLVVEAKKKLRRQEDNEETE